MFLNEKKRKRNLKRTREKKISKKKKEQRKKWVGEKRARENVGKEKQGAKERT